MLLRQADRALGLTEQVAKALIDPRRRASCRHDALAIVRQRVYSLALGYEDLNDHDQLRRDLALQTAVEKDRVLASASTLCRFEKRAGREQAVRMHEVLVEQFIASYPRPPRASDTGLPTPPMTGCMGSRRGGFITAITTPTVFCPCMCFAGTGCW